MNRSYTWTRIACYVGYITQAVTINLTTLFFVIFQNSYGISFSRLGQLVLITFLIQLTVDLVSIKAMAKIGYRTAAIAAHVCATLGLVLLGTLPNVMVSPYTGILIACFFYSIGGGLTEVIISPLIDALPSDAKASSMSLLHSFYSWGFCLVVLGTTPLLLLFGQEHWMFIPFFWALIPLVNTFLFCIVPIPEERQTEEKGTPPGKLIRCGTFIIFFLLMVCSGAAEQTMSQWASLFAEKAIGVSKVVGDLLGPCLFAVLMAIGRTLYGLLGQKIPMTKALFGCALLTVGCYLLTIFGRLPAVALIGCAACGFGVSLMWPGVLSIASARFPRGGTPMFAILAFGGDLGCSFGPWLSGVFSDAVKNGTVPALSALYGDIEQIALKSGMLVCVIFPLAMAVLLAFLLKRKSKQK